MLCVFEKLPAGAIAVYEVEPDDGYSYVAGEEQKVLAISKHRRVVVPLEALFPLPELVRLLDDLLRTYREAFPAKTPILLIPHREDGKFGLALGISKGQGAGEHIDTTEQVAQRIHELCS